MNESPEFNYPNRMGKIIMEAMREVIGENGLNAILRQAGLDQLAGNPPSKESQGSFSFETVSALLAGLEHAHGPRGGRGIAIRVGRVAFKYGLREYGPELGVTGIDFRLLPPGAKIRTGGQRLADLLNRETDQRVSIQERDGKLLWVNERCPECRGRHSEEAVCQLIVGLLQESLYWVSGGKIFNVEETLCIAKGDACCTIEIDQTPLA